MRRGELAGLLRHDIDFEHGPVTPSAPRVSVDGHVQESETKTESGRARDWRWTPDTRERCASTSIAGTRSASCWARTPTAVRLARRQPLHPDTITALFHKHCRSRRPATHPAARRPALLRHRRPQGRRLPEDHQRAPRPRHRRVHAADLHARHPRHGRGRREHGGGPDPGGRDRRRRLRQCAVRISGRRSPNGPEKTLAWAKAQVSDGSGGRI